ncbi:sunset domain-containing protein [Companilactobacillus zhongbaensis]|uniref:sunset domain-containing protein n=1 Tax=Companilactobacillus zhongbaensis TaxID=2486009 RepID=UPI000F7B8603|nr:hypothetical protein [Companilactobacillus zhongbaensis]
MTLIGIMLVIAMITIVVINLQNVRLKPLLATGAVFLTMALVLTGCSEEETDSTSSSTDQTEQISKKEYDQAKKEHKQLVATNQQLDEELAKTEQERKQLEEKNESQNSAPAVTASPEQSNDYQQEDQPTTNNNANNSGDEMISGGDSQYIIGNVNSHVYHLPGQRGYSMKSKNAVYFSSEQEAINAGYRKAKQ